MEKSLIDILKKEMVGKSFYHTKRRAVYDILDIAPSPKNSDEIHIHAYKVDVESDSSLPLQEIQYLRKPTENEISAAKEYAELLFWI